MRNFFPCYIVVDLEVAVSPLLKKPASGILHTPKDCLDEDTFLKFRRDVVCVVVCLDSATEFSVSWKSLDLPSPTQQDIFNLWDNYCPFERQSEFYFSTLLNPLFHGFLLNSSILAYGNDASDSVSPQGVQSFNDRP